jgi:hypothetical protein
MSQALAETPAQTGDLWHARLYLLRPVLRISLILLWLISGLVGLLASNQSILAAVPAGLLPEFAILFLGRAGAVADVLIAALLLWGGFPRLTFWMQLVMVLGYTALLTLLAPSLWLALYGPLLKNIPIIAAIIADRVLAEER